MLSGWGLAVGEGFEDGDEVTVFGGDLADTLAHYRELPSSRGPDYVWATTITLTESTIGRLAATRIDSITDCPNTGDPLPV